MDARNIKEVKNEVLEYVMATGTIKKIVSDKGFGFIEGGKKDVFFHCSAVVDTDFDSLSEGDAVSFDVKQGDKGPRAENVRLQD